MDDETYVKMKFHQPPETIFYMSRIRGNVPNKYKRVLVDKFGKKLFGKQFAAADVKHPLL